MKILKAQKNISEFVVQYFEVKSLRIIPSNDWLIKRSNEFGYNESFEKHGMIWPIAVTDHRQQWVKDRILPKNPQHKDKDGNLIPGYYVHIGNKRVLWARDNGYDMIEGYYFHTMEDKRKIHQLQHIAHTEIPK
jgi:hypothetical protein